MGTRSTVKGYWRQAGNSISNNATPGVVPHYVPVTFDGAAANTTATGVYLPKGAIVIGAMIISDHTGGTSPAFDVGITGTADGYIDGSVSTTTAQLGFSGLGSLATGVALTADTEITAGDDGTGTAGSGNITVLIEVVMQDDGKQNN